MRLMRLEAVHITVVMKSTEGLLVNYLSVQHDKDAVVWERSIRMYQDVPALRSQIMVT